MKFCLSYAKVYVDNKFRQMLQTIPKQLPKPFCQPFEIVNTNVKPFFPMLLLQPSTGHSDPRSLCHIQVFNRFIKVVEVNTNCARAPEARQGQASPFLSHTPDEHALATVWGAFHASRKRSWHTSSLFMLGTWHCSVCNKQVPDRYWRCWCGSQ